MHVTIDIGFAPIEARLLIADIADDVPRRLDQIVGADLGWAANLTRKHDAICCCKSLERDARVRVRREVEVDNGVGNLIADLIGMPLRYGFARKKIVLA